MNFSGRDMTSFSINDPHAVEVANEMVALLTLRWRAGEKSVYSQKALEYLMEKYLPENGDAT